MKRKGLVTVALLLAVTSVAAATEEHLMLQYNKLVFNRQTIEIQKADGSVANAQFLSEIILLKDGRANGGFGILGQGAAETLSLYRVSEARKTGPFFTFKGERLYPLPVQEITVRLPWPQGQAPTGSVKFLIDGPTSSDSLSLTANGTAASGSGPINFIDSEFSFVFLNAPPQTVEVASATDLIISPFNSAALIFPTVGGIGSLDLTAPTGEPLPYHYGPGVYKTTNGGQTWAVMAMAENHITPREGIMIMIRPHPDPFEPCRIYDIAGTQVPTLKHFEAETSLTPYKLER
jgi:hypothetical protein